MLDITRTRIAETFEYDLLSSVNIEQEGLALQLAIENGIGKARPTNATADAQFVGVTWGERFAVPTAVPHAEIVTLDSTGQAKLSRVPTAEADMLVILGTGYGGTVLANNASPTSGQWDLVGADVVASNASNANKQVFVVYRYNISVLEAQMRFGDAFPGPRAMNSVRRVGVITKGTVYTSCYDTAVDWSAIDSLSSSEGIKGGANGMFTVGGNGADLRGHAHVIEVPTIGSPYLGLYIDR